MDPSVLTANIDFFAKSMRFDNNRITWPNGSWPHSGLAIVAEDHDWVQSCTGGIVPISRSSKQPVTYDGIATKSSKFVLAAQGADCPTVFLYDPQARVIGIAHSGWKPTVRGVVRNTVAAMTKLGASPANMSAFISPGVGDFYYDFEWDDEMEPIKREVFVEAGREDLLVDETIRHQMTDQEKQLVTAVTGRELASGISFMFSRVIGCDLENEGVRPENIDWSKHSTICEQYDHSGSDGPVFKYHSSRRDMDKDPERPGFGLNLAVLFLVE